MVRLNTFILETMNKTFFGLFLSLISICSCRNNSDPTKMPRVTDELKLTIKTGGYQDKYYDTEGEKIRYTVIKITVKNISRDTQSYAYWSGDPAYPFVINTKRVKIFYLGAVDHNEPSQTILAPGQVEEHQVEVIKADSSYAIPEFRIGLVWLKFKRNSIGTRYNPALTDTDNFKAHRISYYEKVEDLQQKPYKIIWSNELRCY